MLYKRRQFGRAIFLLLGGVVVLVLVSSPVQAGPAIDGLLRGEMARLYRQAYDYHYRNSNRNVFRSSRHFHPTRNIFRSSRYYQQRLAASFDGYPLSTTVRYRHQEGEHDEEHVYTFTHARRYPIGPTGAIGGLYGNVYPTYLNPGYSVAYPTSFSYDMPVDATRRQAGPDARTAYERPRPRTRSEIEMVPAQVHRAEPTQEAIMQQITQEDGTVRTIITSVPRKPDESSLDEAWKFLAVGDYDRAAQAFLTESQDDDLGAQAMFGYGLIRLMQGDIEAATIAMKRSLMIDPEIIKGISIDAATKATLTRIIELNAANSDVDDANTFISQTIKSLLNE